MAKKRPAYQGVRNFNALDTQALDRLLGEIEVGEVWGLAVGWPSA